MKRTTAAILIVLPLCLIAAVLLLYETGWMSVVEAKIVGARTVADRLAQFGPGVRNRLLPDFQRAQVSYPPARVVLLGLKQEKRLEVYASSENGALTLIREYPVLAASGGAGPKQREGDRQVPEGVYSIESLNPNSRFHLALRLNYPNQFDRQRAAEDGLSNLGSDIMIHGKDRSIGCLAMGDDAAEDLFVLAAEAGIENVRVVLAPCDLRIAPAPRSSSPAWVGKLYAQLADEMRELATTSRKQPAS